MRHSAAVAMLKSGADPSSISLWLGHASLNTTNKYAKIDLEMKRKAIAQVKTIPRSSRAPWNKNRSTLDWLESLWRFQMWSCLP
jgi:integrase/recombinase XerD